MQKATAASAATAGQPVRTDAVAAPADTADWSRRSAGHSAISAPRATTAHSPNPTMTQPSENDHWPWLMATRATPKTGTRKRIRPAQFTPGR